MGNQKLLEKQKNDILKNIRVSVEKHVSFFFNAPDVSEEGICKYASIYKDDVSVLSVIEELEKDIMEVNYEQV